MAKKKQLSKDLYAIAKKCPHLQLCKSTKKGAWLDCRLKKGCACAPGASYCTQVQFRPLFNEPITRWSESTQNPSIYYQQEPRVNWAIDICAMPSCVDYKKKDDQSVKNFLREMEQDVQEKEDEKSIITDKQLDEMIANLSSGQTIQEVILETIQSLQRDVSLINEKLAKIESTGGLDKHKQTLGDWFLTRNMGDYVSEKLGELNPPETQELHHKVTTREPRKTNAYIIYPAFRPVHLYKKNGHYLYTYYNETLDREVISNVTGTEKFVHMDELNRSLYRRFQELGEQTRKNGKEKQEIMAHLKEQVIDL